VGLTTIIPSIEQVRVGQVKGVYVSCQLPPIRSWNTMLFGQIFGEPDTAWLQCIFTFANAVLNKYLDQIADLLQNGFILRRQACRMCEMPLVATLQVFDPSRLFPPARLVGLRRCIYDLQL
jgi:hypothetical protein